LQKNLVSWQALIPFIGSGLLFGPPCTFLHTTLTPATKRTLIGLKGVHQWQTAWAVISHCSIHKSNQTTKSMLFTHSRAT